MSDVDAMVAAVATMGIKQLKGFVMSNGGTLAGLSEKKDLGWQQQQSNRVLTHDNDVSE
jgi:hypothetical protein